MTVRILFVCLGNICRSPMAEGVMREFVGQSGVDIYVDSAGTGSWHKGDAPDGRSIEEAKRHGIDISAQRSRPVVVEDFDLFDLIIAMDYSNLRNLEALRPDAAHAELKLLLGYLPEQPLNEVPDPYYQDGFDRVFDLIKAGCAAMLRSLKL